MNGARPFRRVPRIRCNGPLLPVLAGHRTMRLIHRPAGACLLLIVLATASLHAADPAEPRPLKMADVLAWKNIAASTLSRDGKWFAYRLSPNEGDGEIMLRQLQGDKEVRFPG